MTHEELKKYIKTDVETRYQIHKTGYFRLYPDDTEKEFHSFTLTHLKDQTEKLKNINRTKDAEEIKLYNAEIEVLEYINSISSNEAPQQAKRKVPSKVVIALFCSLINDAGIIKKEVNEIPEFYCERICTLYNLEYSDRVRQNFNGNKSKKHYKELTEHILPHIDALIKDEIQKHLDTKNLVKQNLYG